MIEAGWKEAEEEIQREKVILYIEKKENESEREIKNESEN